MNRRLSTGDDANIYIQKVFSELFHGSARAIIRSLECGLARAMARLKREGLFIELQERLRSNRIQVQRCS